MVAHGLAAHAAAFDLALGDGRQSGAPLVGALVPVREAVSAATEVSMMLIAGGLPLVISTTNLALTGPIDDAQLEADRGPALDAARDGRAIELDDLGDTDGGSFPELALAARACGIAGVLSVPVSNGRAVDGAINVYRASPGPFGPEDREIAQVLGVVASIWLRTSHGVESAVAEADQLRVALASRDVIGQAKGILMVSRKIGPDEAFDLLRRASQSKNTKLRSVAEIVAETGELPLID